MLQEYRQQAQSTAAIEHRLEKLKDNGATAEELALLREGLQIADELQDEQQTALAQVARGEEKAAVSLLYGTAMSRSLSGSRRSSITFA
ncbi:diguanylate cyclase [Klebsiella michiganensis]|uniref:Diguanylate cyclase n=1 Tax=Klebsiella michiganensis TaxID=1134687 RepID=A0A7H4N1A0_9ENTR|nr:diguanylate cyclase [Klebsiella michiganensis]